uniref:Uncharacterized protein n=1 Tax=Archangium disciforme TaxID=38 RepID=Q5ZPB5_9BACT|nr:hypothetical protein [Archangium disciforme]
MTLYELFEADDDRDVPADFPWLLIEIPEEQLRHAALLLNEGEWRPSHISGIWYRVDPERPAQKQQRHVHVAAKKHIKIPTKQASWNRDTTRHDRKTFNAKLGSQGSYQDVAKTALGLPPEAVLEHVVENPAEQQMLLTESTDPQLKTEFYRWLEAQPRRSNFEALVEDAVRLNLPLDLES